MSNEKIKLVENFLKWGIKGGNIWPLKEFTSERSE